MSGAPVVYRHTQRGRLLSAGLAGFGLLVCGSAASRASGAPDWAWVVIGGVAAIVLTSAAVFSSLTVVVDDAGLRWHFTFGLLERRVPRAEIARAEMTATTLLEGVGIHFGPRGWVYNVVLGPAVRVQRADGRAVILGTDDPVGLTAALAAPRAP